MPAGFGAERAKPGALPASGLGNIAMILRVGHLPGRLEMLAYWPDGPGIGDYRSILAHIRHLRDKVRPDPARRPRSSTWEVSAIASATSPGNRSTRNKKPGQTPGLAVHPDQNRISAHTASQNGADSSAPNASPASTFPSRSSRRMPTPSSAARLIVILPRQTGKYSHPAHPKKHAAGC
jgi:hypothetical protein